MIFYSVLCKSHFCTSECLFFDESFYLKMNYYLKMNVISEESLFNWLVIKKRRKKNSTQTIVNWGKWNLQTTVNC